MNVTTVASVLPTDVPPVAGVVGVAPVQIFDGLGFPADSILITHCDGDGFIYYDFGPTVSPTEHFDYIRPWQGPTYVHFAQGQQVWICADKEGQSYKAWPNVRALTIAPPTI